MPPCLSKGRERAGRTNLWEENSSNKQGNLDISHLFSLQSCLNNFVCCRLLKRIVFKSGEEKKNTAMLQNVARSSPGKEGKRILQLARSSS